MKFICPLIVVNDIKRSRDFYEKLGQEVKYDFGENVTFKGDFSIHLVDHFEKLLGEGHNKIISRANNLELYFETEEIKKLYEEIKGEVEFIHGIKEQPWGQRVMRFYDPDFHIIEVGESMEAVVVRYLGTGMTTEEICQKTSLPQEFVQKAIDANSPYQ